MTMIQVTLNDNTTVTAGVEEYNAADLSTKLNDPKLLMVSIGNVIINKNAVKLIAPVPEQSEQ
jgi:NADPH-dependent 7-cyano-7-deazaguanine reductase QueF-like protein